MDFLGHGRSVEEMCRQHPDLTPAEVHAAMTYYWDHREELDDEIRAEWRSADDQCGDGESQPDVVARLKTVRG